MAKHTTNAPAAPAQQEQAQPKPAPKPQAYEAVTTRTMPLGEGTRPAGTVMATCADPNTPIEKMSPAKGVHQRELENLALNQKHCKIRPAESE